MLIDSELGNFINCVTFRNIMKTTIVIRIGITALFEPYPSLEDSARLVYSWYELDHQVFTSLDFATIIFLQSKVVSLSPTPNLEDQVPVFMSPSDKVVQLYPQAPGSLFIASYDSQGYGGIILIRLHMGNIMKIFVCNFALGPKHYLVMECRGVELLLLSLCT
jgi:hypothetical protein